MFPLCSCACLWDFAGWKRADPPTWSELLVDQDKERTHSNTGSFVVLWFCVTFLLSMAAYTSTCIWKHKNVDQMCRKSTAERNGWFHSITRRWIRRTLTLDGDGDYRSRRAINTCALTQNIPMSQMPGLYEVCPHLLPAVGMDPKWEIITVLIPVNPFCFQTVLKTTLLWRSKLLVGAFDIALCW